MMHPKSTSYPTLGLLEWFRPGEHERVDKVLADLRNMGITHLRTGLSWADYFTPGAKEWYDWLFPLLAKEVEVLPCLLYTPPSIGIAPKTSSPPKNHKDYADFLDVMITDYGKHFEWVELWNEPNNKVEYDFTLDPSWDMFAKMISGAGYWAKHRGKKTVLGGMSPIDPNWLNMMFYKGVMDHIDALGVHGFPDVFDQQWDGWNNNLGRVREVMNKNNAKCELWITEVGFSTWQNDEYKQVKEFQNVLKANVDRIYWYSAYDLDPVNATVGGFHLDDREYHFGLKHTDGTPKLLFNLIEKYGVGQIGNLPHIEKHNETVGQERYALVTGGAGFVGTNIAKVLLESGRKVMIYDNLSAPGSEDNLKWLYDNFKDDLIVKIADIRDAHAIKSALTGATELYHLAGNSSSIEDTPYAHFDINIKGAMVLLEALKATKHFIPTVVFSSELITDTQIDGNLADDASKTLQNNDQYFQYYRKKYHLPIIVIKSAAVYGCFLQHADHIQLNSFIHAAIANQMVQIDGSSQQPYEFINAEDLANAAVAAAKNINELPEAVYHVRANQDHQLTLLELLDKLKQLVQLDFHIIFCGTSFPDKKHRDNSLIFNKLALWTPTVSFDQGILKTADWINQKKGNNIKI